MSLTIRKEFAPVKPGVNCTGYGNGKKFITVHQTGNTSRGANAAMHAKLQFNNPRDASWHYQVDDKEAVQSFTHDVQCWHASDGSYGAGNANSIAIESCVNSDGDYVQTIKNTAELVAHIMKQEGIPLSNVYQHNHWARDHKNCPTQLRSGKDGITWDEFLRMAQNELDLLNGKRVVEGAQVSKPVAPTAKPNQVQNAGGIINMSGRFVPNDTILVRDQPSTSGRHVATYQKGEALNYDRVHMKNGYVWLEYTSFGGAKRYIPIAPLVQGVWGNLQ